MSANIIKTSCPTCRNPLEFPQDLSNLVCVSCGTTFEVREYKGAVSLSATEGGVITLDAQLLEIEEAIDELGSEIEALKSREQGAPLQRGCAAFGLFWLAVLVIALFMTVAKNYFASIWFYLSLAAVITLGALRMRRRLPSPELLDQLRRQRLSLTESLEQAEAERERLRGLKEKIEMRDRDLPVKENGG